MPRARLQKARMARPWLASCGPNTANGSAWRPCTRAWMSSGRIRAFYRQGKRQKAKGRRHKAEGTRQKAQGRRHKTECTRQKDAPGPQALGLKPPGPQVLKTPRPLEVD